MTPTRRPGFWRGCLPAGVVAFAACGGDSGPNDDTPGTKVELSYCVDRPTWVAVQDGDGPWIRVLPIAEGQYEATFKSERGAVATIGGGAGLRVNYGTLPELAGIRCDLGYKYVMGTVSGITFPQKASTALGGASGLVRRDTIRIRNAADGPQDFFAVRRNIGEGGRFSFADRVIVRRDQDLPGNTSMPHVNFDSSEAFAPAIATFSVSNQGNAQTTSFTSFWYGRDAARGSLTFGDPEGATSGQYTAVPLDRLAAGDMSSFEVYALDSPQAGRFALEYFRAPSDITIELGPALNAPVVTIPTGGQAMRPQVQLASQADYGRMVVVTFYQVYGQIYGTSVTVAMTSAYLGGTPATWDIEVPDLSAADGWNDAWGLVPAFSVSWWLRAEGGVDRYLGDAVHEGDVFLSADYSGSNPVALRSPSVNGRPEPHRGGSPKPLEP